MESIGFSPEEQKKFEKVGGLMNPPPKVATAKKNQDRMMHWIESFEDLQAEINGMLYNGFDLFRRVYQGFPDICSMTKEEATAQGIYPIIHYRNHAARKWMAKMNRGHLAILDEEYNGELRNIYDATTGPTNLQKLAKMGQAPFGWRNADDGGVYELGDWASIASGLLGANGNVRALHAPLRWPVVANDWFWQSKAVGAVVVLNK